MDKKSQKRIIIIGSGWYGCYLTTILKDNYDVTIIEKNNEIFNESSYYNQSRLHIGYHYCRDYKTRQLCLNNYEKFLNQFTNCVDMIDKNYYVISKESIIDFNTFNSIYKYEKYNFDLIENKFLENIDGDLILTNEAVINCDKIKTYFNNELKDINIILNTKVNKYEKTNNMINVICDNKSYECDYLFDCTYNQLCLSKQSYIYELTITLLFKRINPTPFNGITIIDGKFCSLYPRDIKNNIFTLTDVEYTPIISSKNYDVINSYKVSQEEVENIKIKMINKIKKYYHDFDNNFIYESYFLAKKTKMMSNSDSRDIIIEQVDENITSINCGKITGIFELNNIMKQTNLTD